MTLDPRFRHNAQSPVASGPAPAQNSAPTPNQHQAPAFASDDTHLGFAAAACPPFPGLSK